jgi:Tfp pilus assembly protein FimT
MRPRPHTSSRAGFTLLELTLTIGLLGFVLVSARMLFSRVADTRTLVSSDAARADSLRNGERLARILLRSAESTPDSAERFVGNERNATFTTWCRVGGGWLERCRVTLLLDHRQDTTVLVAELPANEHLELMRRPGLGEFRYLDRSSPDTNWFDNWGTNILLPDAVAIVAPGDTMILVTGGHSG